MKLHELLPIWHVVDEESKKQLASLERPAYIKPRRLYLTRLLINIIAWWKVAKFRLSGRIPVPSNLDNITIGQVLVLSQSQDVLLPFKELLKMDDAQILMLDVEEAVGFLNFVRTELKRINELLATAKAEPTSEERQAGIDKVGQGIGSFGMLDYIAKRCNCTHDEAAEMGWRRVFAMMVLDRDNELFRRRLTEIYQKKRK